MDLRQIIHLASTQPVKVNAARYGFGEVIEHKAPSEVPNQPFGREEIRRGAVNRLNSVTSLPALSYETGLVLIHNGEEALPCDISCCLLRTSLGLFEEWTTPHHIRNVSAYQRWFELNDRNTTFGSYAYPDSANDWYVADRSECSSRQHLLGQATLTLIEMYEACLRSMPMTTIPAPLRDFRGVAFLDLQYPLSKYSNELNETTFRLTNNLLFNKVLAIDARGFLLIGEFARRKYPIVMARKPGKLPSEELTVSYAKEYGTDSLCIAKDAVQPGDAVIVVDDVIATGGTMRACEKLVQMAGGRVVAFVAPYAIVDSQNNFICGDLLSRCRFLCTQKQAAEAMNANMFNQKVVSSGRGVWFHPDVAMIFPPSLYRYDYMNLAVPVRWGRFARSSNIWFDPERIRDRRLFVFLDPANEAEAFDVLQLLKILHRKDPKQLTVVIPFLEQSTQDRVEYDDRGWESVAMVDTIAKVMGEVTIRTFDLHAEQSRFAFHDLRFDNLVEKLWDKYRAMYPNATAVFPDEGAAKRYAKVLKGVNHLTFRKVRDGDKRVVKTDDAVTADHYVVIDDMVRSGGTMREVATFLLGRSARRVDALFTHAPLEPAAAKNMAVFTDVWTTDTCPNLVPHEWVKLRIYDYLLDR